MASRFKTVLWSGLPVGIGAFFFILPAFLNGFPFVFPDSGDYLVLHPLLHRSPYYALLITLFHLNRFIWLPIVMQCLVVSHLLWVTLRLTWPARTRTHFILLVAFLALFSSLPYFTGFIMADIFTPVMFLTMYLIAFHFQALSRSLLGYLLLLDAAATACHISNFTLAFGLLVLFAGLKYLAGTCRRSYLSLALLTLPITATGVAIFLFNIIIFHSWALSPAGQSFLLANLIQYGPARHYLEENCKSSPYKICAYVEELPQTADELLWSSDIYHKLGDFPGMQIEAKEIVEQTLLTRPFEVAAMVARNFGLGLITHAPTAEFHRAIQVPSFAPLIAQKFGDGAERAYEQSAEMRDALPYDLLRFSDQIVFSITMIYLIWAVYRFRKSRSSDLFLLPVSVLCFVLADTLLCTALSGVHDRYQARVTWLAELAAFIVILKSYQRTLPLEERSPPVRPQDTQAIDTGA